MKYTIVFFLFMTMCTNTFSRELTDAEVEKIIAKVLSDKSMKNDIRKVVKQSIKEAKRLSSTKKNVKKSTKEKLVRKKNIKDCSDTKTS